MKVVFSAAARQQLYEATITYAQERRTLSVEFVEPVVGAVDLIQVFPRIGVRVNHRYRKIVLQRFPYVLIYSIADDRLRIATVHHQRRGPGIWCHRIEDLPAVYSLQPAA